MKQAVSSAPILRYFNSSEPVEGQADASANGIGFVLMQNGQPVSYPSRALITSERNYSQSENDLLAQVFGVEPGAGEKTPQIFVSESSNKT